MKNQKTIIIKRVKKVAAGHHGGSWKVAYADFVTAMMAFFLLLWLLSMTSDEKRVRVSAYFQNFSIYTESGSSLVLDRSSQIFGESGENREKVHSQRYGETNIDSRGESRSEGDTKHKYVEGEKGTTVATKRGGETFQEKNKKYAKEAENIKQSLQSNIMAKLGNINDQILIDIVEEGIRIQLIDKHGSKMFESGNSRMTPHAKEIFKIIGENIKDLPNKISIEGHTDAVPYAKFAYSNWELSTERALAARRVLEGNGVKPERVLRVSGFAATDPLIDDDPTDPRNRRISIIISMEDMIKQPQQEEEAVPAEKPDDTKEVHRETSPEIADRVKEELESAVKDPAEVSKPRTEWSPILEDTRYNPIMNDSVPPAEKGNYSPVTSGTPFTEDINGFPSSERSSSTDTTAVKVPSTIIRDKASAEEIMRPLIEKLKNRSKIIKTKETSPLPKGRYKPLTDELGSPVLNRNKSLIEGLSDTSPAKETIAAKSSPAENRNIKINRQRIPASSLKKTEEGSDLKNTPEKNGFIPEIQKNELSPVFKKESWSPVIKTD